MLKDEEPIVLDSNPLMARRLESIIPELERESRPKGFQSGLNAPQIDSALIDMENSTYNPEGFGAEDLLEEAVYTGPSPEELIAEAQAEIDEMRKEAEKNISFLKVSEIEKF